MIASGMMDYDISDNDYRCNTSVRNGMNKANRPSYMRIVIYGDSKLPTFSFDPIMDEIISACGKQ